MNETLFDKKLLTERRRRAASAIHSHDFLLSRACEDLTERLKTVTRDFPVALNLCAHHGTMGRALAKFQSIKTLIDADACPVLLDHCCGARTACDEEFLPFAPASLDLVVSALGLQFTNDLPGALVQICRALKPDGLFLGALLGGNTLHELHSSMMQAENECEGGASPHIIPFTDVRDCGALLQRTGFALPVTDTDRFSVTYASAFDLMRDIRAMGAGNMLVQRSRKPMRRETLFRMAELYAENHAAPNERISATFEIIYMTGWAPDESQPKALKPGSAQSRLADALRTKEHTAGERPGLSGKPQEGEEGGPDG